MFGLIVVSTAAGGGLVKCTVAAGRRWIFVVALSKDNFSCVCFDGNNCKILFFYMYFPVSLSKPVWGSNKDSSYFNPKYFLK